MIIASRPLLAPWRGLFFGWLTLEAAKQAFRAAWDRRPKARGKSPCVAENNN
jgi:hypothetical protein